MTTPPETQQEFEPVNLTVEERGKLMQTLQEMDEEVVAANLNNSRLSIFDKETKDLYHFVHRRLRLAGMNIPAMVIATAAGFNFQKEANVVQDVLKVYGKDQTTGSDGEGVYWKGFKNHEMKFPENGKLLFDLPGQPNGFVLRQKGNRGSPTYYMGSAEFLYLVLCQSQNAICKKFCLLAMTMGQIFYDSCEQIAHNRAQRAMKSSSSSSCCSSSSTPPVSPTTLSSAVDALVPSEFRVNIRKRQMELGLGHKELDLQIRVEQETFTGKQKMQLELDIAKQKRHLEVDMEKQQKKLDFETAKQRKNLETEMAKLDFEIEKETKQLDFEATKQKKKLETEMTKLDFEIEKETKLIKLTGLKNKRSITEVHKEDMHKRMKIDEEEENNEIVFIPRYFAPPENVLSPKRLRISHVAVRHFDKIFSKEELMVIGSIAAKLYKKKYGRDPPKVKEMGSISNKYTRKHEKLLKKSIRQFLDSQKE